MITVTTCGTNVCVCFHDPPLPPTSSPPPLTGAVSADEKHKCKPEDQVLVGFVYSLLYVGIHVHVHVHVYSYTVAQHVQM